MIYTVRTASIQLKSIKILQTELRFHHQLTKCTKYPSTSILLFWTFRLSLHATYHAEAPGYNKQIINNKYKTNISYKYNKFHPRNINIYCIIHKIFGCRLSKWKLIEDLAFWRPTSPKVIIWRWDKKESLHKMLKNYRFQRSVLHVSNVSILATHKIIMIMPTNHSFLWLKHRNKSTEKQIMHATTAHIHTTHSAAAAFTLHQLHG